MKLTKEQARNLIPSLRMIISVLQARKSVAATQLRYRAERLRNKILTNQAVYEQDFRDIEVSMNRLPESEKFIKGQALVLRIGRR